MISQAEAIQIAHKAAEAVATLQPNCPTQVSLSNNQYTVVFIHVNSPGTRGPDYDAKVTINAESGTVIKLLGAS